MMKGRKVDARELQTLSRLFSYPENWPEANDLKGMAIKGDNGWDGEIGQNDLQVLQNSYVSLFINALPEVPCPPYGSVYLEGALMGGSTIRVRNLYLEYGFQTEEMADHIAVELEFLAFLTTLSNDNPPREDYDFLLDHLRAWTPEFFDRVENKDEIGFYRDVSRYAKSVIFRASQA